MTKQKNYKVWSGGRGKIFATQAEAEAYANWFFRCYGYIVTVTLTKQPITSKYRLENI